VIKHECDMLDKREEAVEKYKDSQGDMTVIPASVICERAVRVLGEDRVRELFATWLLDEMLEAEFERLEDAAEYDRAVAAEGGDE
jgi:hypothetical protein